MSGDLPESEVVARMRPAEVLRARAAEIERLRARVAELERESERLRGELARLGLPEVVAAWE